MLYQRKMITYQTINIQSQSRIIIQLCVIEVNEEIEVSPHGVFFDNVMTKSLKKRYSFNHHRQRLKKNGNLIFEKSSFLSLTVQFATKIVSPISMMNTIFKFRNSTLYNTVFPKRIKKKYNVGLIEEQHLNFHKLKQR